MRYDTRERRTNVERAPRRLSLSDASGVRRAFLDLDAGHLYCGDEERRADMTAQLRAEGHEVLGTTEIPVPAKYEPWGTYPMGEYVRVIAAFHEVGRLYPRTNALAVLDDELRAPATA